jgi:hypothetical protein
MNLGVLARLRRDIRPDLMGSLRSSDVCRGSGARLGLVSPKNRPGLRDGGVGKEPHSKEVPAHMVYLFGNRPHLG